MSEQSQKCFEFGPFRIDITEPQLLLREGEVVRLEPRDFDLLVMLVRNAGHKLTNDELLEALWPDQYPDIDDFNLTVRIAKLRRVLGDNRSKPRYIQTVWRSGYRFVAQVKECGKSDLPRAIPTPAQVPTLKQIEPPNYLVPLGSEYYVSRPADHAFAEAIARHDGIVLVKGAHQTGKSSLLLRGQNQARDAAWKEVWTDFGIFIRDDLASADALYRALAEDLSEQLALDVQLDEIWQPRRGGHNRNFTRFLQREILDTLESPLVWFLELNERLFQCDFKDDLFALFRDWYNRRMRNPADPFCRLVVVIAYGTEASLFINDINQSPFNVGTQLLLEDFTDAQVADLNQRHGSPLRDQSQLAHFIELVGGHPYLVRHGLYTMTTQQMDLTGLAAIADHDEGPFGRHLREMWWKRLKPFEELCTVMRALLRGQPCPDDGRFYRLWSAGLVLRTDAGKIRMRSRLYQNYLSRQLQVDD